MITKKQIISTMAYWYEKELESCKRSLLSDNHAQASWVDHYIKECLGVAFFIQELDIPFEEINGLYENVRERFEQMKKDFLNDALT